MKIHILLFLTVTVCGCAGGSHVDPLEVRKIIDQKNAIIERWYAEGKIDSAAMFFAENCWQMPPNSKPLVGRKAYREFWSQAVQWGTWKFDLQAQEVLVEDSLAVERGKYILTFEAGPEAPMPSSEDRGNYVALWRLDPDGEWRIYWDAPVSELPPGSG